MLAFARKTTGGSTEIANFGSRIRYEICTIWEANSQMLSTLAGAPLKERPVPKQFIGILMAWLARGAA